MMETFEERLSAFLDRALTPDEEAELLHTLSVSPDKRVLLHEHLDLRARLLADMQALTVPPALDAAVFSALGLSAAVTSVGAGAGAAGAGAAGAGAAGAGAAGAGAAGAGAAGAGAAGAGAAGAGAMSDGAGGTGGTAATVHTRGRWFRRGMAGALLAGAFFAAGWFAHQTDLVPVPPRPYAFGMGDGRMQDAEGNPGGAQVLHEDAASGGSAADIIASTRDHRSEAAGGRRVVQRSAAESTAGMTSVVVVTRVDTVFVPTKADVPALAQNPSPSILVDTVYVVHTERVEVPVDRILPTPQSVPPLLSHLELEVAREHATTYPYIDYRRLNSQRAQQQLAVMVGWRLDEHHAVGLAGGRKSFAQEFYRMRGDSLTFIQQQPELTWAAGFYRYAHQIVGGVIPHAMIQLGGSDLGPILGMRLGVAFEPVDHLQFTIGGTGMLLLYRYGDRLFTSHTLGVAYGVNVRF